MNRNVKIERLVLAIFVLIFSRLIPHPPDFGPSIVISLLLARESKWPLALFSVLFSFVIADGLLAWWQGYAWFGDWTVFTYSALIIITLLSAYFHCFGFFTAFNATLFYWCWTNFGTWLMSGMYPHNSFGFVACYTAALPFLGYSFMGTLVWYFAITPIRFQKLLQT